MKPLPYERVPIDATVFSPLPRDTFLVSDVGQRESLLFDLSAKDVRAPESARGDPLTSAKYRSRYAPNFAGEIGYLRMDDTTRWIFLSYVRDDRFTYLSQHLPSTWGKHRKNHTLPMQFSQAVVRLKRAFFVTRALRKWFQNVPEKPNIGQQLLTTSPKSPILIAAVKSSPNDLVARIFGAVGGSLFAS